MGGWWALSCILLLLSLFNYCSSLLPSFFLCLLLFCNSNLRHLYDLKSVSSAVVQTNEQTNKQKTTTNKQRGALKTIIASSDYNYKYKTNKKTKEINNNNNNCIKKTRMMTTTKQQQQQQQQQQQRQRH